MQALLALISHSCLPHIFSCWLLVARSWKPPKTIIKVILIMCSHSITYQSAPISSSHIFCAFFNPKFTEEQMQINQIASELTLSCFYFLRLKIKSQNLNSTCGQSLYTMVLPWCLAIVTPDIGSACICNTSRLVMWCLRCASAWISLSETPFCPSMERESRTEGGCAPTMKRVTTKSKCLKWTPNKGNGQRRSLILSFKWWVS